jgi:hypothetical protein
MIVSRVSVKHCDSSVHGESITMVCILDIAIFIVINDYKFTFNDETAQIDHLIVYPYGFILIESKVLRVKLKLTL